MRIVPDTNDLSGLQNQNGPLGRIIDMALSVKIKLLYDDRILS